MTSRLRISSPLRRKARASCVNNSASLVAKTLKEGRNKEKSAKSLYEEVAFDIIFSHPGLSHSKYADMIRTEFKKRDLYHSDDIVERYITHSLKTF